MAGVEADVIRFTVTAVRREDVLFTQTPSVERSTDVALTPGHVTPAFFTHENTRSAIFKLIKQPVVKPVVKPVVQPV